MLMFNVNLMLIVIMQCDVMFPAIFDQCNLGILH